MLNMHTLLCVQIPCMTSSVPTHKTHVLHFWDSLHLKTLTTRIMRIALTPVSAVALATHRQLPRSEHIHVPSTARTM